MITDPTGTSELAHVARPLLTLMHRLSGLETTFISRIDWADQRQEVVVALNTDGGLQIAEKSWVDWSDSMCRWIFLSGHEQSTDVAGDFPGSLGDVHLGMKTFVAVPIVTGEDEVLGTVCGASRATIPVAEETLEMMRLVSQALGHLMESEVAARADRLRAEHAELDSMAMRAQAADAVNVAQALETLALIDSLTGLANRRGFMVRLEEELARSGRHDYPIAVLRLDIDKFKAVNDTHGHDAGDRVLATLGAVLGDVARVEDVSGRPGGDEFAVALPYCNTGGARDIAARIADEFAAAQTFLPHPCTVSIGIANSLLTPRREIWEAADRALYAAKRAGGNGTHTWPGALTEAAIA
ncbi:MAG: GGDEF domain-containing protein [Candidatus Dormibacteraeota bacterium]|uniref:GGDEF domain-containing protein n=1 Tax=Candidatus Amunia macphersoniae TaxID=3127014 RepID=A0A934KHY8_9BACT|nr:GGDEF domain-containing protein [Candidatus Dormibacteraeota bacterium]